MRHLLHIVAAVTVAVGAWAQQPRPVSQAHAGSYRISGTVVDAATRTPLAKAAVTVTSTQGARQTIATVVTGTDGRFAFDHLAPAKYAIFAQRRGYLTESLDQHENFMSAVAVGPNLVSEGIVFPLHAEASLSGRVLDDANEPVRSAQIMLFTKDEDGHMATAAGAQTNDEGAYHIPHLRAGTYVVGTVAQPWYAQHPAAHVENGPDGAQIVEAQPSQLDVAYPCTFYPDITEVDSATPIVITAGERATADITLRAVPAVRLRVRVPETAGDKQGRPPVGVHLRKKIGDTYMDIPTSMMGGMPGAVDVTGLAPGPYEVITIINEVGGHRDARQEVDLESNSEIDASQSGVPLTSVSGRLQLEGGQSSDASRLTITLNSPGQTSSARVKENGEFEFGEALPSGKYEIAVVSQNVYLKSVVANGTLVNSREIDVSGDAMKLSLIAGEGVGTVEGVALRDGKPQAGAMIVLVPENPATQQVLFRRDQSDSDGTFTLPSVVPGRYVVIAVGRWDFAWRNPEALGSYLAGGQPIQVQPRGAYHIKVQVQ